MKRAAQASDGLPATFDELVRLHVPRAIQDSQDYENTAEIIDKLAVLNRRTTGQEQYLETLTILVERYDQEHHALGAATLTPLEALRYVVEQSGTSASELGRILGDRSLGSKLLRGERKLEKYARKLADHFGVRADLFL